jgi:hypothetical protein
MHTSVYYSPLFLILSSLMVCSIDAHSSHNDSPADPSADFLTVHMDKEHHIQVSTTEKCMSEIKRDTTAI